MEGVLKTMLLSKLKTAEMVLLVVFGMIAFGGGSFIYQGATAQTRTVERVVEGTPTNETKPQAGGSVGRYTVVSAEATGFIVTDDKVNTLYFYSADPGNEPGAGLKRRGSVDLTRVGKPTISLQLTKKVQEAK
jgi:hypothetical protein